jgi:hypothetical protein
MKAPKEYKRARKTLPTEATFDERLLACARRLYTGTNDKGETICYLPWHYRRPPQTTQERELLLVLIGRKLLPTQPEFNRGSGKKPGSKMDRRDDILPTSRHRRALRDRKEYEKWWTECVAMIRGIDGEDVPVYLGEPPDG